MRIKHVRPFILHLPVSGGGIADSTHAITHWGIVGVELETENGLHGWGFTGTHAHLPSDRLITACIRDCFGEHLVGQDAQDGSALIERLRALPPVQWVGRAGVTQLALAAIDVALWDLRSKAADLPLYRYLGGTSRKQLPAYQTDVGWLSLPIDQLVDGTRRAVEEDGFIGVKLKVGSPEIGTDLKRIQAVRQALGPGVMLAVDGNGKWDLPTALRFCREASAFDLFWFEEPLWYDDVQGHATLARQSDVPIALGEQLYTCEAFAQFFACDAVHFAQPDITRLVGVTDFLRVADTALTFRLPVAPHVGDMGQVHVHLAYHHPACTILEYIPWIRHAFADPIVVQDGHYQRPQQPGAGTTPTDDALRQYQQPV